MNTRQEIKAKKRAKWLATPPGIIEKPLRHIAKRARFSLHYTIALAAAKRGDGLSVQQMARSLA